MFLKELILIRQANQKSVIFVTIAFSLNKRFKFQPYVCNICHDLLVMFMNFSNIAILEIKNADFCCIIIGIRKSEAIKLLQSIDLTKTSGTL